MSKRFYIVVTLLFLCMAALRMYRLDTVALRGDEAFSVIHWTGTPFTQDWFELLSNEPHPPGTFLLFWLWSSTVGTSEFAMRMLVVLSSLIGGAVIIALARRLFRNATLAVLAGILWAINPFLIWHAQDIRNYAITSMIAPLSIYFLLKAIRHPHATVSMRPWILYIPVQILGLYIYLFEIFTMAVAGLFLLIISARNHAMLRRVVMTYAIIAIASIPIMIQLYALVFVTDYQGTAQTADVVQLFERFIPTLWFGDNTAPVILSIGFVFISVMGLLSIKREWSLLLIFWGFLPMVFLYVASNFSSIFRPRYVIHVIPAFILIALSLTYSTMAQWKRPQTGIMASVLLTVAITMISAVEVRDYFFNDPPKSPDWRGLTDYLEDRMTMDTIVITSEPDPAIEYYLQHDVYYVPLDNNRPTDDLDTLLATNDAIFTLASNRIGQSIDYLQNTAQIIPGDTYPGVGQYRPWMVNPREIEHPLELVVGDVALLRGYTVLDGEAGGVTVLLYWEALQQTAVEHSILTHIVPDVANFESVPLIAALDHGLAGSIVSTTTWQAGAVIRDPVVLPRGNGERVRVLVGIYETQNPDLMLPMTDAAGQGVNSSRYDLGVVITLKPD